QQTRISFKVIAMDNTVLVSSDGQELAKSAADDGRVLLPPGEGGAKRRMRAGMGKLCGARALTRRFAPPSRGGRGTLTKHVQFLAVCLIASLLVTPAFAASRIKDIGHFAGVR